MSLACVRKFLDLSTVHLPEPVFRQIAMGQNPSSNLLVGDCGIMVHVPSDMDSLDASTPKELMPIYQAALTADADYIMFDQDAGVSTGLPTFEDSWE